MSIIKGKRDLALGPLALRLPPVAPTTPQGERIAGLEAPQLTRAPGLTASVVAKVERQGLLRRPNSVMGVLASQLRGDEVIAFTNKVDYMTAVSERLGDHRPLKTNPRTVVADAGPFFGVTKRARTGVDAGFPSGAQLRTIMAAYTGETSGTPDVRALLAQIDGGLKPSGPVDLYVPLVGVHADVEAGSIGDTRKVELKYASVIQKNPLAVAAAVLERAKAKQAAAIREARQQGKAISVPLVIETDAVKALFPVWHGKEPLAKQLLQAPVVKLEDAKIMILEGRLKDARAALKAIDASGLAADSSAHKELGALEAVLQNPATLADPAVAAATAHVLASSFKPSARAELIDHVAARGFSGTKSFVSAARLGRTATIARLGRGKYNQVLHQHADVVAKLAVQLAALEVAQTKGTVCAGIMGGTVNAGKGYCLKASDDARAQYGGLDLVFDCAGEQNSIEMPWLRSFLDDMHAAGDVEKSPKMTAIFVDKHYRSTWMHDEFSVLHRGVESGRTPHVADVLDASILGPSNFATFYLNECLPRGDTDAIVLGYGPGGKPFAHSDPAEFCLEKISESVARLLYEQKSITTIGKEAFADDFLSQSATGADGGVAQRSEQHRAWFDAWLRTVDPNCLEHLDQPAQLAAFGATLEPFGMGLDSDIWLGQARSPEDRDNLLRGFGNTLRMLKLSVETSPTNALAKIAMSSDGVHSAPDDRRICTLSSKVGLDVRVQEMRQWTDTAEVAKALKLAAPWLDLSRKNRLDKVHGGQWRERVQ